MIALTGRPFSATMPTREFVRPTVLVGLRTDREALDVRVDRRAQRMFDAGLVEETRGLVDLGLREGRTASRAVGYAQALAVIDGTATLEDAVADTGAAHPPARAPPGVVVRRRPAGQPGSTRSSADAWDDGSSTGCVGARDATMVPHG